MSYLGIPNPPAAPPSIPDPRGASGVMPGGSPPTPPSAPDSAGRWEATAVRRCAAWSSWFWYSLAAFVSLLAFAVIRNLQAVPMVLIPALTALVAAPVDCQPETGTVGNVGATAAARASQRCATVRRPSGVTLRVGEVMEKLYLKDAIQGIKPTLSLPSMNTPTASEVFGVFSS